jgi:hypothetical protein
MVHWNLSGEDMPQFTVEKGKRYRATLQLSLLQSIATNEMVADEFRKAGFTDVAVEGSGSTRYATGLWSQDNATAEMPSEVSEITTIA